jgi:SAM-dependent methyltransferase
MSPAGLLVALDVAPQAARTAARLSRADGVRGDIGALPFPNGAFDLILAGHVLYYAADIRRWAHELRRVLDASGVLLASANSAASARRLLRFHVQACQRARLDAMAQRALAPTERERFTLENGAVQLGGEFGRVEVHARDDPLVLEDVEAALRLYRSGPHTRGAGPLRSATEVRSLADVLTPHMRAILGTAAEADGSIVIPRRHGCFVARP